MTGRSIGQLLAAAEPTDARPLSDLVGRLSGAGLLADASSVGTEIVSGGIVYDSRRSRPGSVFVAIVGDHLDGHDFAAAAATSCRPMRCDSRAVASAVASAASDSFSR